MFDRVYSFTVQINDSVWYCRRDTDTIGQWRQEIRNRKGHVLLSNSIPESIVLGFLLFLRGKGYSVEVERFSLSNNRDFSPYSS
jgi:hypothetical protein